MKEFSKNKRGISLIVLVITIIVMIILATAIILSLNSSDIIGKANEAKTSSDTANKKAAASVLLAEYELAVVNGETTKTASEYVKEGLAAQGIDASDIAITEDGEILVGTAALFINNEVPIGTTVTGYKLSQAASAKTYTTSGEENTSESDPIPATITRDESITWKYFGIDENGEALIVGSVTASSPKITLGGKGGYLNGPSTLKTICETMYSSEMGTARSMDWEDVTRILEYEGHEGTYDDADGNEIKTDKALTIGEIETKLGTTLSERSTPDGSDIANFKSDYVSLPKTSTDIKAGDTEKSLVYQSTAYWLASPCVNALFTDDYADFDVRCVDSTYVSMHMMFDSTVCDYGGSECAVRPVVSLSSNVQVAYDGTTVTLS